MLDDAERESAEDISLLVSVFNIKLGDDNRATLVASRELLEYILSRKIKIVYSGNPSTFTEGDRENGYPKEYILKINNPEEYLLAIKEEFPKL